MANPLNTTPRPNSLPTQTRRARIAATAAILAIVGAGLTMPLVVAKAKHHPKAATAAQIYEVFQKAGLPVSGLIVYTAATDPNHLLGRPTGYTSTCAWVDSRVPATDATAPSTGDIGNGGSVEVFPSAARAKERAKYIFTLETAAPILGSEYDYLTGGVLIRISQYLTPAQAATYGKAEKAKLYTG